ncbi:MAG TPA: hypothetical protein P5205_14460 [Candidatus Paceibacterota bacterium]|nr:hypothetical protein [Candidatus Paceibacterota bacterium]
MSERIFGCFVDNNHDERVAVAGIDFHLDRIRFDAADRGGADLGQHPHRYGPTR